MTMARMFTTLATPAPTRSLAGFRPCAPLFAAPWPNLPVSASSQWRRNLRISASVDHDTFSRFQDIISEKLDINISTIKRNSKFSNLRNFDSRNSAEIFHAVQEDFDIDLELYKTTKCVTVQNALDLIQRAIDSKGDY